MESVPVAASDDLPAVHATDRSAGIVRARERAEVLANRRRLDVLLNDIYKIHCWPEHANKSEDLCDGKLRAISCTPRRAAG